MGTDEEEQADLGGWCFHSRMPVKDDDDLCGGLFKFSDCYYRMVEGPQIEPDCWIIPAKFAMVIVKSMYDALTCGMTV